MPNDDAAGHCGRCRSRIISDEDRETCWYCLADLCYECWDEYGHCGHSEAEETNRRARQVQQQEAPMSNDDAPVSLMQLMESQPADQIELAINAIARNTLSDRRPSWEEVADSLSFPEIAELLKMIRRVPRFVHRFLYLTLRISGTDVERRRSVKEWTDYLLKLSGMIDRLKDA